MRCDDCPFCNADFATSHENSVGVAFRDGFPVSQGHTLIIPKQHVDSLFELSQKEQSVLWKLVAEVRDELASELDPDGFNVGVNDGAAAGQTVMHAHIHVVPRWDGDVVDPRGGVRWVIPEKACYWGDE